MLSVLWRVGRLGQSSVVVMHTAIPASASDPPQPLPSNAQQRKNQIRNYALKILDHFPSHSVNAAHARDVLFLIQMIEEQNALLQIAAQKLMKAIEEEKQQ